MRTDVNVFLGSYPFRRIPGTSVGAILEAMERVGTDEAWVSHLPGVFWKDPAEGNGWLYEVSGMEPSLRPVPAVQPELAHWEEILDEAKARKAPAVRCDPGFHGMDPTGSPIRSLIAACGEIGLPLMMAVRLEDIRQRHPNDAAPDLTPGAVRALVRSHPKTRFAITNAERSFVEEVHFGSTPEEAARIWWDICWIWGPPENHLATLLSTVGPDRFVYGTAMPLRIPENGVAKLDLTNMSSEHRAMIESGNARRLSGMEQS
ncbi:MAG: amidohydrolase family protein [Gemmatimonadota bacterium]